MKCLNSVSANKVLNILNRFFKTAELIGQIIQLSRELFDLACFENQMLI